MGAWLSESAIGALGVFGLTTRDIARCDGAREQRARAGAEAIEEALREREGRVALILGPSGSGKSTLLRAVRSMLDARGERVVDAGDRLDQAMRSMSERRVIDVLTDCSARVDDALAALSAAGLADAFVPARRIGELSDGQRARLAIALAVVAARACPQAPCTLLLDELAGALDDATAEGVCATLGRWVRGTGLVRLIAVGTREGALEWLGPDVLARVRDDGNATIAPHNPAVTRVEAPRIVPGSLADYHALAHLHYRAGRPATVVRVLAAHAAARLVGVLVVSMPTLNGAWRAHAWPGDYGGGPGKRDAALRLNRDVRCISRVIVEPRWRARGVGAALVRAYLADPLTPRTEAVSAMGAACPIFARAGMREWILDRSPRDTRLADAIEAAGLRPWMIADIDAALEAASRHLFLDTALRTWARAHGPTRPLATGPLENILQAAARSVVQKPRAYTSG